MDRFLLRRLVTRTPAGLASIGLALLLTACPSQGPPPDVLASSGLGPVTRAELEDYILSLPEKRRSPGENQDPAAWRRSMVEEVLDLRALEAEAENRSLAEEPEVVEVLASRTEPLLAAEVRDRRIRERVQITDEDLRTFYDENPEEFGHGERIRLRNIFRRVERNASASVREAARKEMEKMLVDLRQGANFADLAKAHSDSETADLGGLIGKIDRGVFNPELEKLIWSLKDGELSEVLETPVGFQIFKLESHIPPFKMEFEEARNRLRRRLAQEATDATMEEYFQELLEASGAVYQPEGLKGDDVNAVLFELGELRLTLADWRARQEIRSVFGQRDPEPEEQLKTIARDQLFVWEATRQGLRDEPEMAKVLANTQRSVLTTRLLQEALEKELAEKYESEIQAYYDEHKRRYQSPRLVQVRVLTRNFPNGEVSYQVYEELVALVRDLRAGKRDFADAAQKLSDDPTAYRGGDFGLVRLDAFAEWAGPPAQRAVAEMEVGEISEPMLIERYDDRLLRYDRQGYMLVRVEAIQEPGIISFEEALPRLNRDYLRSHGDGVREALRNKRLAAIGAKIHEANL